MRKADFRKNLPKILWVIAFVRTLIWILMPFICVMFDPKITLGEYLSESIQRSSHFEPVVVNGLFGIIIGILFIVAILRFCKALNDGRKSRWFYLALYVYLLQTSKTFWRQPSIGTSGYLNTYYGIVFVVLLCTLVTLAARYHFIWAEPKEESTATELD